MPSEKLPSKQELDVLEHALQEQDQNNELHLQESEILEDDFDQAQMKLDELAKRDSLGGEYDETIQEEFKDLRKQLEEIYKKYESEE